ncbi:threonylcarbamoyl-AMP synthase [Candidatus Saccharibacteria bacterium]|nr:threonylcarbamoyl-AMP synthase [Candidatus Saccharibacteria bacterium]
MSYITSRFDGMVAGLLEKGAVGFIPTDTIYGLSAKALDEQAVVKVRSIKDRHKNKPLIVLIADPSQLSELGGAESQARSATKYWPGPLTVIFTSNEFPVWLTGGTDTLAVRMPGNEKLRQLIKKTGPLVSTSANPQGKKPAESVKQAKKYFDSKLDFYVDVGELSNRQPSTIVKLVDGRLQIIRQGDVKI